MKLIKIRNFALKNIEAISITAIIFVCFYFVARIIIFQFSDYNPVDKLFGVLLLLGETYILIHTLGYVLNILRPSDDNYETMQLEFGRGTLPAVAVIIAARHEPKNILEDTITALVNLDYDNKNIYLLDDSSDEKYKSEADEIGRQFNISVFRRDERHGAKAGIVNDIIRNMKEKYVAVFDADQTPMPDFLKKTIAILENDEKIAFVQTPQFYTNIAVSPIAKGSTIQQAIFYESICEGKSKGNAMFCCGTNVVFRIEALLSVGGFDEKSITEDFATSIKLHMKGYKSVYYNHVCAFGMAPESLPAYFKQQTRWSAGTISIFKRIVKYFLKEPGKLTLLQWWEYMLAGTYYFIGWAFFLLMICPIAYLMFDVPSFFMRSEIYIGSFVPYFLLTMLIFYSSMSVRNYKMADIYYGTILGMISFPILMKSALYGLFGKRMTFVITTKGKADNMPLLSLWPWIIMILLNIMALVFGIYKVINKINTVPALVNMFWVMYHIFILSNIFYFNRIPKIEDENIT